MKTILLSLLLVVFEQVAAGGASNPDGKLIITEAQISLKATPRLQGQRPQADGKRTAQPL